MKLEPKSPVPQAAPWTGGAVFENDRVPSPAAETIKEVIEGTIATDPPEPKRQRKPVRATRPKGR